MSLLILGCTEPFDGFDFQAHNAKLVIEAILTDDQELGYVRISYTEPIEGESLPNFEPEDGAVVTVTDDQGTDYVFQAQGEGLYANAGFSPDFGTEYRMLVQVGSNRYESDWQQLPQPSASAMDVNYRPDTVQLLNDLGNPVNELAITLNDKVIKRAEDSFYYWHLNYYYIYEAYGQPDVLPLLPDAVRFCYVREHDKAELIIHDARAITGLTDSEYELDIASIPFGRKMIYDYSVQVIRYNVPQNQYEYFSAIKRQINNVGGVFDAAPSTIPGNFEVTGGDLPVLGYFGVFNATSQRIFFNQDELPFNKLYLPTDAVSCPGDHNVELSNVCFNCLALAVPFNSATKPDWWR